MVRREGLPENHFYTPPKLSTAIGGWFCRQKQFAHYEKPEINQDIRFRVAIGPLRIP